MSSYTIIHDGTYSTIQRIEAQPDATFEIYKTLGEARSELLKELRFMRDEYAYAVSRIARLRVTDCGDFDLRDARESI